MNLYSVLLVDDEEEVYSVIMKKLDWEAMGFRIAGYARNGVEALEMAEEIQPDVVMTDIKMPYMDGLTLSKKLKELYQKIKIIIFSGFDEFEYAKEAIKIGISDYLLKPVSSAGLIDALKKAADEIMELLLAVNRRGNTVLLVTHEQRYADLCGRKIEISDGRI